MRSPLQCDPIALVTLMDNLWTALAPMDLYAPWSNYDLLSTLEIAIKIKNVIEAKLKECVTWQFVVFVYSHGEKDVTFCISCLISQEKAWVFLCVYGSRERTRIAKNKDTMGKWVPRLDTRGAYPMFHTVYVKITREGMTCLIENSCWGSFAFWRN